MPTNLTPDTERETTQVASPPRRMIARAIGAEDGQCAAYYAGILHRCTNDAEYHAYMEFEGEWKAVEMCPEHVRSGELPGEGDTDDSDRSDRADRDGTHDLTEYTK